MTLTIAEVEQLLDERNACFMAADLESYLALWSDDGILELNAFVCEGKGKISDTISFAWSMLTCLHMETRSFAVNGQRILNEFAIVWKNNESAEVSLQTGAGVIEVNSQGKLTYLRDYFDAGDGQRASALQSRAVRRLLER